MSDQFARSPRGYAYLTEGRRFPRQGEHIAFCAEYSHDPVIESLWNDYRGLVGTQAPLSLVLLLIDRLKKLFGDFQEWTWIQAAANRAVHGYALDFILDTIGFVQTGRREYSVSTWESLIDTSPVLVDLEISQRIDLFKDISLPNIETLITDWLKQEGGVDDMFHTARILFGKANQ